ncbi:MAG: hypothetical protein ACO2ON_03965 [Candidatus Nanopusillus sp.]
MVYKTIPEWVGGPEKFRELYKEFKMALFRERVLEFLKKRIFEPYNVQYKDYGDYLEIINHKNNKIYLFLYVDFDDIDEWDDLFENPVYDSIIDIALEKIEDAFKRNQKYKIEQYRAYVIGKNIIAHVFTDRWGYDWFASYFFNREGKCKPDDYSFLKFLITLRQKGIIKRKNNIQL